MLPVQEKKNQQKRASIFWLFPGRFNKQTPTLPLKELRTSHQQLLIFGGACASEKFKVSS